MTPAISEEQRLLSFIRDLKQNSHMSILHNSKISIINLTKTKSKAQNNQKN